MAECFYKVDKRRPLKDGSCPIKIGVGYGRDLYISTGVSVNPDNWDSEGNVCTGPNAKKKNSDLLLAYTQIVSRVTQLRHDKLFETLTNAEIRSYIQTGELAKPEEKSRNSLGEIYRKVIAVKRGRHAQILNDTLKKLEKFTDVDKVTFDEINKLWLDSFCASMPNLAPNTLSIHLRNLRNVFNYAIDCGITTNYPFLRYRIPHAKTRKRAFDAEVIRKIATADLDPWCSTYRDLFMLTFYLIGINVVDLCNLTEIKNGRIEYVRAKTHKPYSIKVEPEALEIIQRLKGERYLLYMLEKHHTYRTFYMQFCRGLNRIATKLGLSELTTYWGRHSWATIASSLDIPKDTIAHALGHGSNSITDVYIDFDMKKVDIANRQVIDYVLYQN